MPLGARLHPAASVLAAIVVAATLVAGSPTSVAEVPVQVCDPLCARVRAELAVFTGWLKANSAMGYVGEVGWPNDTLDAPRWNAVAERWYADADAAGLPVTAWATGEWWGTAYRLSVYADELSGTSVDSPRAQAPVVEAHPTTWRYRRGVNAAGGEFGSPVDQPTSPFSNANPGAPEVKYHYDSQATFSYLASRGVRIVRLPFRWERIQPAIGGPLSSGEVQRLKDVVARARVSGLEVVLDMHNYGAYYLSNGSSGVRRPLGSAQVTKADFADVWSRISRVFSQNPGVYAYGLMNEPVGVEPAAGLTPARRWEIISQAAVDAIRANLDAKTLMVAGYNWSGAQQWTSQHPRAWIVDPFAKTRYEAHHYFDRDNSGKYGYSYDADLADAIARGYTTLK